MTRFAQATGQQLPTSTLYDDIISLSGKTTFEAITHALITTPLTDDAGAPLGDALSLVERVEAVKGRMTSVVKSDVSKPAASRRDRHAFRHDEIDDSDPGSCCGRATRRGSALHA